VKGVSAVHWDLLGWPGRLGRLLRAASVGLLCHYGPVFETVMRI